MNFKKFPKSEKDFKGLEWYPWFQMEEWRQNRIDELLKLVNRMEKTYCVDAKCQGLLDCKICLECPLTEHIRNYKALIDTLK